MRQLIKVTLMMVLFSPQWAWTFTDTATLMAVEVAHQEIAKSQKFSDRMMAIVRLRKLVNERLNTINIPNPLSLPDNDPRIENFRSLNEFEGYLDLMISRRANISDCDKIASSIRISTISQSYEALKAIALLADVCRK